MPWWAQKVIVEYEQSRGVRRPGARPDGTFTAGASKTLAVPAPVAFAAVTDAVTRRRWLPDLALTERTSTANRSARFDAADGTRVNVTIAAVGESRCSMAVEQTHLAETGPAEAAKARWRERLTELKALVEGDR